MKYDHLNDGEKRRLDKELASSLILSGSGGVKEVTVPVNKDRGICRMEYVSKLRVKGGREFHLYSDSTQGLVFFHELKEEATPYYSVSMAEILQRILEVE